jgi:hypothetical protein
VLAKNAEGRLAMTQVTLRPVVTFAGAKPTPEQFAQLHDETHERCFIANSVKTEVIVEPASPERHMSENLIVEKRNTVAIVTLNRPEVRNAFDDV